MQIFRRLTLVAALLALSSGAAVPAERPESSAYSVARQALIEHDYARALPDLKYAADHGVFIAQYYVARLYAMNGQPFTNHAKAFQLFERLVATYRGVDPYLDNRAPFVAKAELLLAFYYRSGIQSAGVPADALKAKAHLEHAALRLVDTDARYELGMMDLQNQETIARGLDALDDLAQNKHHAAAAAQIAQFYSQGRYAQKSPDQALAYASLAMKLASDADRFWISDIYQTIYCQTGSSDRVKANAFESELEHNVLNPAEGDTEPQQIGPAAPPRVRGVLDLTDAAGTLRECANGDVVPDEAQSPGLNSRGSLSKRVREAGAAGTKRGFNSVVGFIGPPMGIGLKDLETPRAINENGETENAEPGPETN